MEVQQDNSMEQNTSMEELKVDEDESLKESSLEEDMLGAQSLLMTDSDEENNQNIDTGNCNLPKKISPKRTKRIVDSDDENDEMNSVKDKVVDINSAKSANKISALVDSDSEEDIENTKGETKHFMEDLNDKEAGANDTQNVDFKQIKRNLKKKSETTAKDQKTIKKTKNKSIKIKENTSLEDANETSKKKPMKVTPLIDSETDESDSNMGNNNGADLEAPAGSLTSKENDNEQNSSEFGKNQRVVRVCINPNVFI